MKPVDHDWLGFCFFQDDLINHESLRPGKRVCLVALPVIEKQETKVTIYFEVEIEVKEIRSSRN